MFARKQENGIGKDISEKLNGDAEHKIIEVNETIFESIVEL